MLERKVKQIFNEMVGGIFLELLNKEQTLS